MDKLNISKLLEEKERVTINIVGDSITWGLLIAEMMRQMKH